MDRCPIKAVEQLLLSHGIVSESEKIQIYESIDKEIEEAIIFAKESPYPDESGLLKGVFKT